MEKIIKLKKEIKVGFKCDVLVVGGGVSGFGAAVSASRAGVDVILIEKNEFLGGVATSAMMNSITNFLSSENDDLAVSGLSVEFINRLVKEGGISKSFARKGQPQIPNEPETFKRIMIEILNEARVKILYDTVAYDYIKDNDNNTYLVCNGMEENFAIKTKIIVDSTGELTIFKLAGAKYDECDDFASLLFRMADVNIDKFIDWLENHPENYDNQADIPTSLEDTIINWRDYGVFHIPHYSGKSMPVIRRALENNEISETYGKHAKDLCAMGMYAGKVNDGIVVINSMAFNGDSFNIKWASQCEEEGRLAAKVIADILVKYFPGFENSYLIDTASEIGFRRNRKLHSKRIIKKKELEDALEFDDAIGQVIGIDERIKGNRHRFNKPAQIPLSCLVTEGIDNVILGSGKNVGANSYGLLRSQIGCMTVGQGAGIVAALSVMHGFKLNNASENDIELIQRELIERQFVKIGDISYD